jgi:hypothetical protein
MFLIHPGPVTLFGDTGARGHIRRRRRRRGGPGWGLRGFLGMPQGGRHQQTSRNHDKKQPLSHTHLPGDQRAAALSGRTSPHFVRPGNGGTARQPMAAAPDPP